VLSFSSFLASVKLPKAEKSSTRDINILQQIEELKREVRNGKVGFFSNELACRK
jgi:hypothetical protein